MSRRLPAPVLEPRKQPVQRRSTVTVDAIHEAALQVLLGGGIDVLTTTRVAERAGVSVGSLYQYYPNKQSLLAAVLARYLGTVLDEVEQACSAAEGATLTHATVALVDAYFDAKFRRPDISRALYAIPADEGKDLVVRAVQRRGQFAVARLFGTLSDVRPADPETAAFLVCTALTGPVRGLLEIGADTRVIADARRHCIALVEGYLRTIAPD